jgi:hypothetical protein
VRWPGPDWPAGPVVPFLAGLALGVVVSLITDRWIAGILAAPPRRKGVFDQKFILTYMAKYTLDVGAMFLAYRNIRMLLGVALGLALSIGLQIRRTRRLNAGGPGQAQRGGPRRP